MVGVQSYWVFKSEFSILFFKVIVILVNVVGILEEVLERSLVQRSIGGVVVFKGGVGVEWFKVSISEIRDFSIVQGSRLSF